MGSAANTASARPTESIPPSFGQSPPPSVGPYLRSRWTTRSASAESVNALNQLNVVGPSVRFLLGPPLSMSLDSAARSVPDILPSLFSSQHSGSSGIGGNRRTAKLEHQAALENRASHLAREEFSGHTSIIRDSFLEQSASLRIIC